MTWLYIPPEHLPWPSPSTSSPCAQASEGSTSESTLRSTFWERLDGVWLTWRGKLQPPQAWSRRWKQGGYIRRLSGLTLEPSMLDLGVASFISSLRAIHARTTALPESAPVPMASVFSLPKSAGSPKSAGLILSSERTCRGTQADSLQPSSRHWSDWATALRQEYSVRPKPEIPCGASGCSSWPSPMAGSAGTEDYNAAGNSDFSRNAMALATELLEWKAPRSTDAEKGGPNQRGSKGDPMLPSQAAQWATPRTSDTNGAGEHGTGGIDLRTQADQWEAPSVAVVDGSRLTRGGDRSNELLLTGQAVKTSESLTWPAPAARDHKGSSETSIIRQDGKSRSDMLDFAAEQFFHPPSSPDLPTVAGGAMSSTDGPNSNQPSVKRKLNPIFVEALMRWPTGLSGFERPAMALIQWQQLQRSYLLALCSAYSDEPQQMSLF